MAIEDIPDSRLHWFTRTLPWPIVIVVGLTFLGWNIEHWLLDNVVSFVPQIIVLSYGVFLVLMTLHARFLLRDGFHGWLLSTSKFDRFLFIAAGLMIFFLDILSLTAVKELPILTSAENKLTISTYNKRVGVNSVEKGAEQLQSDNTDVIVLQEFTPEEAERLRQKLGYDNIFVSDCDCSVRDTELAILSKYPMTQTQTLFGHPSGIVARTEVVLASEERIILYGVHIPPPFTKDLFEIRANGYDLLAASIESETLRTFIAGDFNTSVFSPVLRNFSSETSKIVKPVFTRRWPVCSWYGLAGEVNCIRIDHIYAPADAGLIGLTKHVSTGSDHRVLTAEIGW